MLRVVTFMLLGLASTVLTAQVTDGEGTWSSPDGTEYIGGFKDGKFHGNGTFIKSDGTKYVGEFQAGKYHGRGTLELPLSRNQFDHDLTYVGEFRNGRYHGEGTLTLRTGHKYVGGFVDGFYGGQGILTRGNEKTSGEFERGAPKNATTDNKGKKVYWCNFQTSLSPCPN